MKKIQYILAGTMLVSLSLGAQAQTQHQEITHRASDKEHYRSEQEYPTYIFLLILVKSRTYELPDLPHQIGESQ